MSFIDCTFDISDKDFHWLSGEEAKSYTGDQVSRRPIFPAVLGYRVQLVDIFTDITLQTCENKPTGPNCTDVGVYNDLFRTDVGKQSIKPTRILLKGYAGMGKTTLARKIVLDWANGTFINYQIVFFVSLSQIRNEETFERSILHQNPWLQGHMEFTEERLKAVLNKYCKQIIFILDGLNEFPHQENQDLKDIIERRKYLRCGYFVTTRQHEIVDILEHFPSVVESKGFSQSQAKQFAEKLLMDKDKVSLIYEFYPPVIKTEKDIYETPIFVTILCLSINNMESAISVAPQKRELLSYGDMFRQIIWKLHVDHQKKTHGKFEEEEFNMMMMRGGKFAFQVMFQQKKLWQKDSIMHDLKGLVDCGLLIVETNYYPIQNNKEDETADIFVEFLHSTIQEFFAAYYITNQVDSGLDIPTLFDGSSKKAAIFMVKFPTFQMFCFYHIQKNSLSQEIESKFGEVIFDFPSIFELVMDMMMKLNAFPSPFHLSDTSLPHLAETRPKSMYHLLHVSKELFSSAEESCKHREDIQTMLNIVEERTMVGVQLMLLRHHANMKKMSYSKVTKIQRECSLVVLPDKCTEIINKFEEKPDFFMHLIEVFKGIASLHDNNTLQDTTVLDTVPAHAALTILIQNKDQICNFISEKGFFAGGWCPLFSFLLKKEPHLKHYLLHVFLKIMFNHLEWTHKITPHEMEAMITDSEMTFCGYVSEDMQKSEKCYFLSDVLIRHPKLIYILWDAFRSVLPREILVHAVSGKHWS